MGPAAAALAEVEVAPEVAEAAVEAVLAD